MINQKILLKIGWLLPLLTILLSSIAHILTGNYRAFPFFISEADFPGIERYLFKGGFFISGIILIFLSWTLFKSYKSRTRWYWMHLSLLAGVTVGINLSLMAIWDIYDHEKLHVFAASNIFHFGLGWGVVTHLAMKDASQRSKNLRYISVSAAFVGFIGMVWSISLGLEVYPEYVDGNWDLDKMQPWINWAAPMEYLMAFSFILTLKSFEEEIGLLEEE